MDVSTKAGHTATVAEPKNDDANPTTTDDAWAAAMDASSQRWYYYNRVTQQRQWDPPPGWIQNDPPTDLDKQQQQQQQSQQQTEYFYIDANSIDQGPFTREQLLRWRGSLPMDLELWYYEGDDDNGNDVGGDDVDGATKGVAPKKERKEKHLTLLADVLGDAQLLAEWRAQNPRYAKVTCAAPPAPAASEKLAVTTTTTATTKVEEDPLVANNNKDNKTAIESSYASLAEAALAGLPDHDEAKQVAQLAAASGQDVHAVMSRHRQALAEQESYTATVLHASGIGKIVSDAHVHTTYAEFGKWMDPRTMEEQMKRAGEGGKGKRRLTAKEVKAVKERKKARKEEKQRAWLLDKDD